MYKYGIHKICVRKLSKFKKITRMFLLVLLFILVLTFLFGLLDHLVEIDFYGGFYYPYYGDVKVLVKQLKNNVPPNIPPINFYNFKYSTDCSHKCKNLPNKLQLVYVVKSSPENFNRRLAIRNLWGSEERFLDIQIRTIFLVGEKNDNFLMSYVEEEYQYYKDIVKANFTDSFYNKTYKVMMGMDWLFKYCLDSQFYMFVDDDYYVSTKNVLRFLENPYNYPEYENDIFVRDPKLNQQDFSEDILYAGYLVHSSPHRLITSTWYVPLEEYPYNMWPPYVLAGAYILSRSALIEMYYTSFYTKHFRFDYVYLGLLAYKAGIKPLHCDYFHFCKIFCNEINVKHSLAIPGYGKSTKLLQMWMEQVQLGHA